jgi:hypothetical protein
VCSDSAIAGVTVHSIECIEPVYRCVLADPRTPVNAKVFLGLAPGLVEERLLLAVEAQKIS